MGGFQETPVLLKTLCKIVCTDRHIHFFSGGLLLLSHFSRV